MTTSPTQNVCFAPDQGDALMSLPPEPEESSAVATWTPKDQVEWNRITAGNTGNGEKYLQLGVRSAKVALGVTCFLCGCGGGGEEANAESELSDQDGDGFFTNGDGAHDCDDTDPAINPAMEEVCDYRDNNCNGKTDESVEGESNERLVDKGLRVAQAQDLDGDGYGNPNTVSRERFCPGEDYVTNVSDCDDGDPAVNPTAPEVPGNDKDENCNGMGDADQDGDESSTDDGDCADVNDKVHPRADESCTDTLDNNCDGQINEECPETELSCDVGPLEYGASWFGECCLDDSDKHTGPEGRYGSGETFDSVSGFSEPIEDGCGHFLPGTANSVAYEAGTSFWINSTPSTDFCVSSGWSDTDESCTGNSMGLVSPTMDDCGQYGQELAVAKLNFEDTGESHGVQVRCGSQEYVENDYESIHNWPSIEVFLKNYSNDSDNGCSEVAWTNYPLAYVTDGNTSINASDTGVIYFAAAGAVPFTCHVSLE